MKPEVIILAGGKGSRLSSLIQDVPKPMASISNRPFLTQLLTQLVESGFNKAVLSVGYKHEVIQQYYGHKFKNLELAYAIESTPLGTGGGILLAMDKIASEHVLIMNGDTYFDADLEGFYKFHLEGNFDLSLLLKNVENNSRYGQVMVEDGKVMGFAEKGLETGSGHINGGIYLINKKVFVDVTKADTFSFETDFMQTFYDTLMFGGYIDQGYFIDIGIPEDYKRANEYFRKLHS
jgi:D-glycero-alpha-D-manno-heptose 1-phosphate guanylyltransferase